MNEWATYTTGGATTAVSADDMLRSIAELNAEMVRFRKLHPDCLVVLREDMGRVRSMSDGGHDRLGGFPVYLAETPDEAKALALRLRFEDGKRPALVGRAGEGWEPKPAADAPAVVEASP